MILRGSQTPFSHTPSALNAGVKRSALLYGHASRLLLGEGSEATEPYNQYANFFDQNSFQFLHSKGCFSH